jgi:hypothetical protein
VKQKKTVNTVYLVHWPEINVMKAGYSKRRRWWSFQRRGAVVVDLIHFDDFSDASAFESVVLAGLRSRGKLAFKSAAEAEPYLGGRGGGWLECYRIPEDLDPMELLRSIDWMSL